MINLNKRMLINSAIALDAKKNVRDLTGGALIPECFNVESDIVHSYQLGATGYIIKPVDMPQFVKAVQQFSSSADWRVLV